jgi:hypothetical protein
MDIAQQIVALSQTDFPAAIRAACAQGTVGAVWFAGKEYTFADGSVLTTRAGKLSASGAVAPIVWTEAKRAEYDV